MVGFWGLDDSHVRDNFGCDEDGLVEYLSDCSKVSYNNQAWSAQ